MIRTIGHVVAYVLFGLLFCVGAVLGIGGAIAAHEPTYWGTFTEARCVPHPRGCQSVGTWTSDDKSIVKTGIALDGFPDSNGTVRASYTPTGFNNDSDLNIVHTAFWTGGKLWFPWVLCAVIAGYVFFDARSWRRNARQRARRAQSSTTAEHRVNAG